MLSKAKTNKIIDILRNDYPSYKCGLDFKSPYQLIVATVLSAQCTDKQVNKVTPGLFEKYPTPNDMANADMEDLTSLINSTGFYKNKSKNLVLLCKRLVSSYQAEVPDKMDDLITLAGVGRKTANVVINEFFEPQGIAVDTHVTRLTNRMGIIKSRDAVKIEARLMRYFYKIDYRAVSHLLISHGRKICSARKPLCDLCSVNSICEKKLAK